MTSKWLDRFDDLLFALSRWVQRRSDNEISMILFGALALVSCLAYLWSR